MIAGAGHRRGVAVVAVTGGNYVFTKFAGGTAAPCALFALGVILSRQENDGELWLPVAIGGLKLVVYPLLCWGLILGVLDVEMDWAKPALMVAAAPPDAPQRYACRRGRGPA